MISLNEYANELRPTDLRFEVPSLAFVPARYLLTKLVPPRRNERLNHDRPEG
ncbi:MAG: hypothetical protein ACTS6G_04260 [Candidatus Hodgkinia cicadicola]